MNTHIDRLREAIRCPEHGHRDCSPLLNGCSRVNQLHDALDALAAELDAAKRERDEAELLLGKTLNQDAMDALSRALRAEEALDAARKALRRIADNAEAWHGDDAAKGRSLAVIASTARAALAAAPADTEWPLAECICPVAGCPVHAAEEE